MTRVFKFFYWYLHLKVFKESVNLYIGAVLQHFVAS